MKKFITKVILFFAVFGFIFLAGILLPTTPRSKDNMLSYKIEKDSLLINVKDPRIIFMGGSNLVFGLNSELIKDSLKRNPINAGLAISIGLIYMMDDILPLIQKGDLVILAPEYNHFYGSYANGGNDLFRLLMDVDHSGFSKLRVQQLPNFAKSVPNYFLSKFTLSNYFYSEEENNVYGKNIFNEYGDSYIHWGMEKRDFPTIFPLSGSSFNYSVIKEIENFNKAIIEKGATLMITYPAIQNASLEIIKDQAAKIQEELKKTDLIILGTPERYSFPDSLMFDSAYHLIKTGVDLRTNRLIEDINQVKR